jgi:hypothetical protein
MPQLVLAFHPLSSLFLLIEVAKFDALPTLRQHDRAASNVPRPNPNAR